MGCFPLRSHVAPLSEINGKRRLAVIHFAVEVNTCSKSDGEVEEYLSQQIRIHKGVGSKTEMSNWLSQLHKAY